MQNLNKRMIREGVVENYLLNRPERRLSLPIKISTAEETSTSTSSIHRCLSWPLWLSSSRLVYQSCSQLPFLVWLSSTLLIECSWLIWNIVPPCTTTRWIHRWSSTSDMPQYFTFLWARGCIRTNKHSKTGYLLWQSATFLCLVSTILVISGTK